MLTIITRIIQLRPPPKTARDRPSTPLGAPFADDKLLTSGLRRVHHKMNVAASGPSAKSKAGSTQPSESSTKRKRGIFQKDLQHMMYGFGDDTNPLPETVALVEDIVVEYVTDFAHKAQEMGSKRGKLSVEDFLYLVRKDGPKLNRCKQLLSMQEELKQARKAFEVEEGL